MQLGNARTVNWPDTIFLSFFPILSFSREHDPNCGLSNHVLRTALFSTMAEAPPPASANTEQDVAHDHGSDIDAGMLDDSADSDVPEPKSAKRKKAASQKEGAPKRTKAATPRKIKPPVLKKLVHSLTKEQLEKLVINFAEQHPEAVAELQQLVPPADVQQMTDELEKLLNKVSHFLYIFDSFRFFVLSLIPNGPAIWTLMPTIV